MRRRRREPKRAPWPLRLIIVIFTWPFRELWRGFRLSFYEKTFRLEGESRWKDNLSPRAQNYINRLPPPQDKPLDIRRTLSNFARAPFVWFWRIMKNVVWAVVLVTLWTLFHKPVLDFFASLRW